MYIYICIYIHIIYVYIFIHIYYIYVCICIYVVLFVIWQGSSPLYPTTMSRSRWSSRSFMCVLWLIYTCVMICLNNLFFPSLLLFFLCNLQGFSPLYPTTTSQSCWSLRSRRSPLLTWPSTTAPWSPMASPCGQQVLQYVAVCCNVLRGVAGCCSEVFGQKSLSHWRMLDIGWLRLVGSLKS